MGSEVAELEALMKEFPDWKEQFPDIYEQLNPPRYHKSVKTNKDAISGIKFSGKSKRVKKTPPLSDYQATYTRKNKARPRSSKRPPPSPRDMNPPPMTLRTNQRDDFGPKSLAERTKPIIKEEQYKPPSAPFDGTSYYQQEFNKSYEILPQISARPPEKSRVSDPNAKFQSRTTNKEHYQKWTAQPSITFGELPSFTQSILYPGKMKVPESTTRGTFRGTKGEKAELVAQSDGNIKLEGNMRMETTSNSTYHSFDGAEPAQKIVFKPEINVKNRGRFNAVTQSKDDFSGFKNQPKPPRAIDPPKATIQLKFNDKTQFDTEQRAQFQGIDTSAHPVAKSCKKEDEGYRPPDTKLDTTTCQQRDYQPIDVSTVYQPPTKQPLSKTSKPNQPFDDVTMNKVQFKKYDVKPRVRYGDLHEGHKYVPPTDKYVISSTNQDTFVEKRAEIPRSYKPEQKGIDSSGPQDFTTSYRSNFNEPNKLGNLDKNQKDSLLTQLRMRKSKTVNNQSKTFSQGQTVVAR